MFALVINKFDSQKGKKKNKGKTEKTKTKAFTIYGRSRAGRDKNRWQFVKFNDFQHKQNSDNSNNNSYNCAENGQKRAKVAKTAGRRLLPFRLFYGQINN